MRLPRLRRLGGAETRANALRWMRAHTFSPLQSSIKWVLCVIFAWLAGNLPVIEDARASGVLSVEGT